MASPQVTATSHRHIVVPVLKHAALFSSCTTQVGYCQGISFVAGVLLLHMSEDQAFDMLKFLMYDLGIRQQFMPDMVSLQVSVRVSVDGPIKHMRD